MKSLLKTVDHRAAVEILARESDAPVEEVRELYDSELTRMRAEARVDTFVSIFVDRKVRAQLRSRRRGH
jgi:hypothetical protein